MGVFLRRAVIFLYLQHRHHRSCRVRRLPRFLQFLHVVVVVNINIMLTNYSQTICQLVDVERTHMRSHCPLLGDTKQDPHGKVPSLVNKSD